LLKRALAVAGVGLAGVAAVNTWLSWRVGAPENTLPGEPRFYHWRRGVRVFNVFYAKDERGAGAPIVLVHGIDAAASSAEWRDVFASLAGKRPVYAPDLLGFGLSDRPSRRYTAAEYVELLDDFIEEVVERPAVVVASSLSAAYAVGVAARSPERVAALLLVCPTGLQRFNQPPTRAQRLVEGFLRLPILGSAAFNLLVSRASIAYFLKERAYGNPKLVTAQIVDQAYRSSHQPGARHAPAAFLGGSLNLDLREVYPALRHPVWIAWGRQARFTPLSDANLFLRTRLGTRLKVFDQPGLLPHAETPAEFGAYLEELLDELGEKDA
jgi:pimeloyl-ACP methyl ester carboxylesterase